LIAQTYVSQLTLISSPDAARRSRVPRLASAVRIAGSSPRNATQATTNTQHQTIRCARISSAGTAASSARYSGNTPQNRNALIAAASPLRYCVAAEDAAAAVVFWPRMEAGREKRWLAAAPQPGWHCLRTARDPKIGSA
jgi:hypothetical protein